MNEPLVVITKEQALDAMDWNDDHVHTFLNPRVNMLIGADMSRADVVEVLDKTKRLELAGPAARATKHGIVAERDGRAVFFATKDEKLAALEVSDV